MRVLVVAFALLVCACDPSTRADGGIPEYGYEVVHTALVQIRNAVVIRRLAGG